jgi:hypothetical protein
MGGLAELEEPWSWGLWSLRARDCANYGLGYSHLK